MLPEDRQHIRRMLRDILQVMIRRACRRETFNFVSETNCQLVKRALTYLWWLYIPGHVVKVKWPVSPESADPNDHYRPWLEENVGRQCWDWDWNTLGADVRDYKITIKFRLGHRKWAMMAALQWK